MKKLFITFFAMGLLLYMGYIFYNQQVKINELNTDISVCERKIQEQNLESEKLTTTIASMSEDTYIEEVARERLGFVMPTEIIFMDSSI